MKFETTAWLGISDSNCRIRPRATQLDLRDNFAGGRRKFGGGDSSRTLRVEIYRIAGRGEGWSLEVIDREGTSTVWDDTFATDQDAYDEFSRALESEGVRSLTTTARAN
jgi:hypothetical protein